MHFPKDSLHGGPIIPVLSEDRGGGTSSSFFHALTRN